MSLVPLTSSVKSILSMTLLLVCWRELTRRDSSMSFSCSFCSLTTMGTDIFPRRKDILRCFLFCVAEQTVQLKKSGPLGKANFLLQVVLFEGWCAH